MIELSLLSLAMLIGQMVYINNLLLCLCLLQVSKERLFSVGCFQNWEADSLTVSIVMSYADMGHLNILRRGYKPPWLGIAPKHRVAAHNSTISTEASEV